MLAQGDAGIPAGGKVRRRISSRLPQRRFGEVRGKERPDVIWHEGRIHFGLDIASP